MQRWQVFAVSDSRRRKVCEIASPTDDVILDMCTSLTIGIVVVVVVVLVVVRVAAAAEALNHKASFTSSRR